MSESEQFFYAVCSFVGWVVFVVLGSVICYRLGRLIAIQERLSVQVNALAKGLERALLPALSPKPEQVAGPKD